MSGEILAAKTSDCQTISALADKEEGFEVFEVSLNLKQFDPRTSALGIINHKVGVVIVDRTHPINLTRPFTQTHSLYPTVSPTPTTTPNKGETSNEHKYHFLNSHYCSNLETHQN